MCDKPDVPVAHKNENGDIGMSRARKYTEKAGNVLDTIMFARSADEGNWSEGADILARGGMS